MAAYDEDLFTMGGSAAERAWHGPREEPGPILVHLLGEFPTAAEWGFSALLGRDAEVVRHSKNTGAELAATLQSLEGSEGGPALVVAAGVGDDASTRRSSRSALPGAAAVAFLLEPSDDPHPLSLGKVSSVRSAVATALRFEGQGPEGAPSVTLAGDWEWRTLSGRTVDPSRSRASGEVSLAAVSEGAYVPRARYLENLPSRWRFLAETCGACGGTTFPARHVCRHCGRSDELAPVELPFDGGRVVAVTTVGPGGQPTEFDPQVAATGPYDVALVELARGMRVTLQVTDCAPGQLRVGDRVNTLLRRLYPMEGEWRYGRKAVPTGPPRRGRAVPSGD